MVKEIYENWLSLRHASTDDRNEQLCYCGHTYKCSCSDPDIECFAESIKNKTIILGDPKNGWVDSIKNLI